MGVVWAASPPHRVQGACDAQLGECLAINRPSRPGRKKRVLANNSAVLGLQGDIRTSDYLFSTPYGGYITNAGSNACIPHPLMPRKVG